MPTRWIGRALLTITAGLANAPAQPAVQLDVVYSCSGGRTKLKILSCAGNSDGDPCEVQYLDSTAAQGLGARISAPRKQVVELLQTCVIQRPPAKVENAPAASAPRATPPVQSNKQPPAPVPAPPVRRPPAPAAQMSSNGIKVGDTVDISTAFGWMQGRVLAINGNSYKVLAPTGAEVWKDYPSELRRPGPANAHDRASGVYELHDKVQVLIDGRWVNGEIITILGMEYQVSLPGNRVAWVNPNQLRLLAAPPKPAPVAKAPGTPCGSKVEGRWSGPMNNLSIEFRSGKAHVTATLLGTDVADCFINGDKVILRKAGEREDMILRLNDDGTMDAPFGELRKKGK